MSLSRECTVLYLPLVYNAWCKESTTQFSNLLSRASDCLERWAVPKLSHQAGSLPFLVHEMACMEAPLPNAEGRSGNPRIFTPPWKMLGGYGERKRKKAAIWAKQTHFFCVQALLFSIPALDGYSNHFFCSLPLLLPSIPLLSTTRRAQKTVLASMLFSRTHSTVCRRKGGGKGKFLGCSNLSSLFSEA